VKYAPRKVYIKERGRYVELSYTDFCCRRESDQTYMDKLFIPVQGCLLEVVREQYTDFYRDADCQPKRPPVPYSAATLELKWRSAKDTLNGQNFQL